jgi:hypothetical protein
VHTYLHIKVEDGDLDGVRLLRAAELHHRLEHLHRRIAAVMDACMVIIRAQAGSSSTEASWILIYNVSRCMLQALLYGAGHVQEEDAVIY